MKRTVFCAALIARRGPILIRPTSEMKRRGSAIHQLIFGVLLGLGSGPSLCGAGGEEQFSKNCAPCHGKDGKAQTSIARKLGVKPRSEQTDGCGNRKTNRERKTRPLREGTGTPTAFLNRARAWPKQPTLGLGCKR